MNDHNKMKIKPAQDSGPEDRWSPAIWENPRNQNHLARSGIIAVCLLIFLLILPPPFRAALFRGLGAHPFMTGFLLAFLLVALSLLWSAGQRIDAVVFLLFNLKGERPAWLDWLMLGFTQLGSGPASLAVAAGLFLAGYHRLAYELILGTLTLWLVVESIKAFIHRSRPFFKLTETRIVGSRAGGKSFPSGHTSQSFFTVTLLIQHFYLNPGLAALLCVLALLVGMTRMYVGAHYPRDVLAGAMLGSVWGILGIIVNLHFL